jgi:hypothetical protein
VLTAVPGTVHLERERKDPHGGPDWVLRSFTARHTHPPGLRGYPKRLRNNGQNWCVQLVRRYHGRLGWIDGDNVFRPAGSNSLDAPLVCSGRLAPFRGEPLEGVATLLTGLSRPDARPLVRVAFGAGGIPALGAELRLGGRTRPLALSRRGAFLEFAPTSDDPGSVTFRYPRRTQMTQRIEDFFVFGNAPPQLPRRRAPAGMVQARAPAGMVQARAPDPNGGPPWAITAKRSGTSGWCVTSPERLVAGHLGTINFRLGTLGSGDIHSYDCPRPDDPRLRDGVVANYLPGSGADPNAAATTSSRGPIERRTSPGTTLGFGVARSDVREITMTTPRDVRTIVPTGPAHAWLVVYDGGFPTGDIVLTAHFADGRSRVVDRFHVGGL